MDGRIAEMRKRAVHSCVVERQRYVKELSGYLKIQIGQKPNWSRVGFRSELDYLRDGGLRKNASHGVGAIGTTRAIADGRVETLSSI